MVSELWLFELLCVFHISAILLKLKSAMLLFFEVGLVES